MTWELRRSLVLEKLRAGKVVSCVKSNLSDPRAVDIIGRCGLDCVWLCLEHVPNTLHDTERQIMAAKMHDMDTVVRVPRGSYSDLIKPLELDATGIMVPHVMDADDARQVVQRVRFHPVGMRPWDGGNADGGYCGVPGEVYLKQANEQRFVIAQIENLSGMKHLDEIAAVEGIDILLYGAGDYSQCLGIPGQFDHPLIEEGRKRVVEAAKKHGKFAGLVALGDNLAGDIEMGYQFINLGGDVTALVKHFRGVEERFAKVVAGLGR